MNERIIIGIIGKKYHGEGTIADMIVDRYNYEKISFANPLKEGCRQIFRLTDEQLYGDKKEVVDEYWGVTPRQLLQFVGTDLFRNQLDQFIPGIGSDIWIKRLEKTFLDNPNTNHVIADIRFQDELDMLKKYNAIIFKVHRSNLLNRDELISERGIDNIVGFDEIIQNDSTISKLNNKIINIINNKYKIK